MRATAAMMTPLRVYVVDGRDRIPAEESGDEDALDLQDLLTVVNPSGEWNGARLKAYLEAGSTIWGGSYVAKVRGKFGGRPRELWWLDLAHVEVRSDSGLQADLYVYNPPKGGRSEWLPSDVIAFRNVNLEDPLKPLSPLSAARYDAATNRYGAQYTASMLRNDGIPKGAFVPQKGAVIEPQQKRSLIQTLRGLRGPKNAGKTPFLNAEIDWKPLSLLPKDAEWLAARKVSRLTVCAALGVPLPLAGDWEGLSQYNVLRDAERFMWHHTLIPDFDWTASVLNDQLVPEFDPTRRKLTVAYDYTMVEALGPVWTDKFDRYLHAAEDQIATPNEVRSVMQIGPAVPWGDKPIPKTQIALRPTDITTAALEDALPGIDVAAIPAPTAAPVASNQPAEGDNSAETLRAFGRGLYKHPAVRAFTAGGPLDPQALLGHPVSDAARAVIEGGLRARQSAAQIADRLAALPVRKGDDATDAVVGQLRAQWPGRELAVVRQGTWTLDPAMKLKKIDYARRPIARNPQRVDDFAAALKVGAPPRPAIIVKPDDADQWTPIDGWHHLLAADHAGLKKYPVYKGEGSPEWVAELLKFNDTIPTPSDTPDDDGGTK
jgi:HK97 family phage portal protein